MAYIYILTMAVAFTVLLGGVQVTFWYKYAIALAWSLAYFIPKILKSKSIRNSDAEHIKNYIFPLLFVMIVTILIWFVNPPQNLVNSNFSRMFSNIFYLILAASSAIAATDYFGRKAIKYSVWAIALSVFANAVYTVSLYGVNLFLSYLPQAVFSTDFPYGSALYNFSLCLEVQDATMATGFYILYFLFMDKDDTKKTRIFYIILLIACSYLGFKRTEYLAIIITSLCIFVIKKFDIKEEKAINFIGAAFIVFGMVYIAVVKYDVFESIVDDLNANVTGRQNIYRNLAAYYEFSPLYIGKGFTYVDKSMYDLTGFASHNTIIRMYAELGFFPFLIWMYLYLIYAPKRITRYFGREAGMVILMCTIYLFLTYNIGNSMNFYCIQFSFILIPIAVSYPYKETSYSRFRLKFKI